MEPPKTKEGKTEMRKPIRLNPMKRKAPSAGEFVKSSKRTTRTKGDPIPNGVVEIKSKIDRNKFVDGVDDMMIKNFWKYSDDLTKDKKKIWAVTSKRNY
ncbi:hypothetical protein AVEN_95608-1 [Araneus ventricosus]|uniref:Uncharacterized protein n=1 Tax=Araneus ventricosus TaxID=182803 RepID=A0A4Y2FZ65_ARAVE|nr:hypothetical protein AVEN_95608-1 [Araneus ventricosus]